MSEVSKELLLERLIREGRRFLEKRFYKSFERILKNLINLPFTVLEEHKDFFSYCKLVSAYLDIIINKTAKKKINYDLF